MPNNLLMFTKFCDYSYVLDLGYLLDDIGKKGRCVLKSECPCESNGKVYQPGEVREGPCGSQWYV